MLKNKRKERKKSCHCENGKACFYIDIVEIS